MWIGETRDRAQGFLIYAGGSVTLRLCLRARVALVAGEAVPGQADCRRGL